MLERMVHTGKGVGGKDKSAIEKGAIHKRGDSGLGLGRCHLKALQHHGHAREKWPTALTHIHRLTVRRAEQVDPKALGSKGTKVY